MYVGYTNGSQMIPLYKIKKFANRLQVGDKFKMPIDRYNTDNPILREYTIVAKYPYIVQLTYRCGRRTFTTAMDYTKIYMYQFSLWKKEHSEDAEYNILYPTQPVKKKWATGERKAVKDLRTGMIYKSIRQAAIAAGVNKSLVRWHVKGLIHDKSKRRWALATPREIADAFNTH